MWSFSSKASSRASNSNGRAKVESGSDASRDTTQPTDGLSSKQASLDDRVVQNNVDARPVVINGKFDKTNRLPRFNISATDKPLPGGKTAIGDGGTRARLLNAFTSSQPVTRRDHLFGRYQELEKLILAVSEQWSHALVYGPRGYGKTSLVRVFGEIADEAEYIVLYLSCGTTSTFSALLRPYLELIPAEYCSRASASSNSDHLSKQATVSDLLPAGDFTARQLANLLATIEETRLIFIFDEYDRIADTSIQREMANLIKDLSDLQARVHLVLVGVASNVQDLLGFHPSIHRSLVCIPINRLNSDDATRIIEHGAAESGLEFDAEVIETIRSIAHGSAYHLRLMCLDAGLAALQHGHTRVDKQSMCEGLRSALEEWSALDENSGRVADIIHKDDFTLAATAAIARTSLANEDRFTISDVVPLLQDLLNAEQARPISLMLGRYCKTLANDYGLLLADTRRRSPPIYRFKNYLAPPFLLMACYLYMLDEPQPKNNLVQARPSQC